MRSTAGTWAERRCSLSLLKVSTRSNPHGVAGAVAGEVREHQRAGIQVVGAGALNQAMKAIAIARGFFLECGDDLVCVPEFTEILIGGNQRTALLLTVELRSTLVGGQPTLQRADALEPLEPLDVLEPLDGEPVLEHERPEPPAILNV